MSGLVFHVHDCDYAGIVVIVVNQRRGITGKSMRAAMRWSDGVLEQRIGKFGLVQAKACSHLQTCVATKRE